MLSRDSHIPENKVQWFIAQGALFLAKATLAFAVSGGISAEGKQEAGRETMMLARRALEIQTQLFGIESLAVANGMGMLAQALRHFNDVDDDEALRLYEQSKAYYSRIQGSLSVNVAVIEYNLGVAHNDRALRARAAGDLDRCIANLEMALPRYREAARIYRAIDRLDDANDAAQAAVKIDLDLRTSRF